MPGEPGRDETILPTTRKLWHYLTMEYPDIGRTAQFLSIGNRIMVHGRILKGNRGSAPPGKSQVAIGFFRNTGKDPPGEGGLYSPL